MTMTEWMKAEVLHNERWEDEGGTTASIEVPRSAGRFVKPVLRSAEPQAMPRQWSTKFSIEPIRTETASGSSKRDAASKG